jgi:hypothetical protein
VTAEGDAVPAVQPMLGSLRKENMTIGADALNRACETA